MILASVFLALALLWRVALPHPFHFTPVLAALLFFGYRAPRKLLWLPALLLAGSDVYLNARYGYKFTPDLYFTWVWYAAMVWLGSALKSKHDALQVGAAALAGSISFFLVSNFSVWLLWSMYPKTLAGLGQCYAAAVPFFRNQFAGDIIFTAAAFSVPLMLRAFAGEAESEGQAL